MSQRKFSGSLREIASILSSIRAIIIEVPIIVLLIIQALQYSYPSWFVEFMRLVTIILVTVLVSYVVIERVSNSIDQKIQYLFYDTHRKISIVCDYYARQDQAFFFVINTHRLPSGKVDDLDHLINKTKELDELWAANVKEIPLVGVHHSSLVGAVISIANDWEIPFEELAPYLIQKLGKERAKRLVNTSDLLAFYGRDCLSTWNELTK